MTGGSSCRSTSRRMYDDALTDGRCGIWLQGDCVSFFSLVSVRPCTPEYVRSIRRGTECMVVNTSRVRDAGPGLCSRVVVEY